ncbi:MAG: carbonic anhydrase [Thermoguttaceae bacterium]
MQHSENESAFESSFPFDIRRIGAAAVYCSDGRFGDQCDDLLHNGLLLPRYDRLAVPGGAACLAGHFATYQEEEAVIKQLRFLVEVHGLERVILIAHDNCAFYSERLSVSPYDLESRQREDMKKAIRRVRGLSENLAVSAYFARLQGGTVVRFEPMDCDG